MQDHTVSAFFKKNHNKIAVGAAVPTVVFGLSGLMTSNHAAGVALLWTALPFAILTMSVLMASLFIPKAAAVGDVRLAETPDGFIGSGPRPWHAVS